MFKLRYKAISNMPLRNSYACGQLEGQRLPYAFGERGGIRSEKEALPDT